MVFDPLKKDAERIKKALGAGPKEPWQMTRLEYSYEQDFPETRPEMLQDVYWRHREEVLNAAIKGDEATTYEKRLIEKRARAISPSDAYRDIHFEVLLGTTDKEQIRQALLVKYGQINRFFEHRDLVEQAIQEGKPVPAKVREEHHGL